VKGIDGTHARKDRVAGFGDVHSGDWRRSRLLLGCIGCGLVLLLLDVVWSQHDGMSVFDGNTSSPPSLAHPGRQ
jgi:hypothetical protein